MSDERYLENAKWVAQNENIIKDCFPKIWTHKENLKNSCFIDKLKSIGIEFNPNENYENYENDENDENDENQKNLSDSLIDFFVGIDFLECKDEYLVRANPEKVF